MTAATPRHVATRCRVLVIEDDEAIRDSLTDLFTSRGFRVVGAENGADAIERVHTHGFRPDAILLDIWMPVMDGLEFLRTRGREPLLAGVPVVVLSVQPPPLTQRDLVFATLQKPVAKDTVVEVVERACARAG